MSTSVRSASAAGATTLSESWGTITWLAGQAVGNAEGVTVGRVVIRAGEANPRHLHHNGEEVLYLLSGRLRHWIGDESVILEAGDTLTVPADIAHYAVNIGDEDADMVVAYSTGNRDFQPQT